MIGGRGVGEPPLELAPAVRRRGGLDATAPVELRATHASWVYLAGADVWKVKRPVDLGFLDFTSLEARRRDCEDEARLNQRLAPSIYLGVEPVRRGPRGLELGGAGPVVDWAVHMRRLPDGASAAARLARGALAPGHLEALAARVADFHRAARETPAWGARARLRANVDENFAETERFVGDLVDRETFEEARAFQTRWLDEHAALLEARVAAGRIREGHGDLRLEHVYFLDDAGDAAPVVIDCVEFAERFRAGDVAADVAFLAMELDLAARPDLAAGFLARYAEAADDLDLYRAVDFYLSYRAWVRGKVAALIASDEDAPPEARKRKRAEARRDFALCRSYAGRALEPPFVVVVGGMIGSGKSTLAEALGRALAAPVISSDRTRKALAGLGARERGGAELYTEAARARVYDELLRRADGVLGSGRPVVLDATFSEARRRGQARELARAHGAEAVVVEVGCAEATLRARLARRRAGGSVSDATDAELGALAGRYEAPRPSEGPALVRVDGELAPARVVADALAGLRREGIVPASERVAG
ncbi:MAG TPA: AAA family ATPase [Polyangia bacterium]|nr:AAA family ATPase [Polyangia bacterium]